VGKKIKKRLTWKKLKKAGVATIFIPGILLSWYIKTGRLNNFDEYYKAKMVFPDSGLVETIEDGDTFDLRSGARIRMLLIDSPARGKDGYEEAGEFLEKLIKDKRVWLEYDRYQNDKYGRILAWVWVDCESKPKFRDPFYMHLTGNRSREGLTENPKGCEKGKLVNEEMVKEDLAKVVKYKGRGPLKYEGRLD